MALTQVQGQMLNGSTNTTTTIQSNGTTAITIDASQNVGIGTSSPAGKLSVYYSANTAYNTGLSVYNSNSGSASTASIQWTNDAGNRAGGYLTSSTCSYYGGTNTFNLGTVDSIPFTFLTGNSERMRLTTGGQLLINQTSSLFGRERIAVYSTTSEGYTSQIEDTTYGQMSLKSINAGASTHYMIQFRTSANSVVGQITHNDSGTAYTTTSDYRLKENVAPMQNALNVVQQLKPVTYTWKSDGSDGQGFIAHELAEVVPDCVTGEKDAVDADGNPQYQGIDTSFLVATLTAAIQELNAKVDAQAAEIKALKGK